MKLLRVFGVEKPLIGMVHLGPLPGCPLDTGDWEGTLRNAVADARAIAEGGMHGCIIENFHDMPYCPHRVPPATIATMTEAGRRIRKEIDLPMGVNVLRNDARAALAVAYAIQAQFIRINIFVGARLTDQGLIEATAWEVQRDRKRYMPDLAIFADVGVKHSTALGASSLVNEASDAASRGFADALIVSGGETGKSASAADLRLVRNTISSLPVLVGSGLTPENAAEMLSFSDGAIVGSSIKKDGRIDRPVDIQRIQKMTKRNI